MTKILALETSCDDTACAIVQNGRQVLATIRRTQSHVATGGVVPEVAARQHLIDVQQVVTDALDTAGLTWDDIDAVAATLGPGLIGSLLVGANTAKTLSLLFEKPFIGVHHLRAHVASNYLGSDLTPPFLCLLVSGGHTQLIHVKHFKDHALMGQTLDDAVGEAYDKIARLLNLPGGGPELDALARSGTPNLVLPRARTEKPFDFSFSGLKTATQRAFLQCQENPAALAASFQQTVVQTLVAKTVGCAQHLNLKTVTLAGGVAANATLRNALSQAVSEQLHGQFYVPDWAYCTDNAAMVGACAFFDPYTTDVGLEVFSRTSKR
jgi:N6-L-threonylcarbamoyladenine synthase